MKTNNEVMTVDEPALHDPEADSAIHTDVYVEGTTENTAIDKDGLKSLSPTDPNHPLNWPKHRKWSTYFTICFFSFLATVNTSKFTVAILPIATEFKVDTTTAAFLVSFSVLALGVGNFFWVIMLRVLGRRPVFLLALPLLAAMNVWSAKAASFGSLLGATILGGFASAAAEAPVSSVVTDLFYVHQRGTMMMVFHLALSAGFFLGPAINSAVIQFAGWRWICGWISITAAVTWLIAILAIRETAYYGTNKNSSQSKGDTKGGLRYVFDVTSGYNKNITWWAASYNTIAIILYPAVSWAGLTVGVFVGWNIVVQVTATRVFVAPPYQFQLYQIGLLAVAGFIGAMVAIFFGGKLIDLLANRMTAQNGGQREPEYRLPAMAIPAIIGPMGILTFGLCVAHKTHWIGAAFGYGMQGFGLTAASNTLVTYAVDSYTSLAGEALVIVFMVRGVSGCLLSLYAYNWVVATGTANAFGQMVAVQYFLLLFTFVFLRYGKRLRDTTVSYGPLKLMKGVEAKVGVIPSPPTADNM